MESELSIIGNCRIGIGNDGNCRELALACGRG